MDYQSELNKLEQELFSLLKQKENKNREIPKSNDILYMSDFDLEKYNNAGDSGKLYLATNKKNPQEKYILKHYYYDCACNEYIYSKIGNKMGIKIAPVKLFVLDAEKNKFNTNFVCGIKYLDNCEHVNYQYVINNQDKINNWQDYKKMICLEALFDECDGHEIVKHKDNIYRIDTTSSFIISGFYIHLTAYDYNNYGINIRKNVEKQILDLGSRKYEKRINEWKKLFCQRYKELIQDYLEICQLFLNVKESDIEEWTNILTYFYPNIIGKYYQEYFKNLKLDVQDFIEEMNKIKNA